MTLLKEYRLGDMKLCYRADEDGCVEMVLYPADFSMEADGKEKREISGSMVQVKLAGDVYYGAYGQGNSMRESESTKKLHFAGQEVTENENGMVVTTILKDDRGYKARHIAEWKTGRPFIQVKTEFINESGQAVWLEMLSSFSLGGLSCFLPGDGHEDLMLHRLRSRWSEEGKLESQTLEELQLNPSWANAGVRSERFGSIGSMPVNRYFPFAAVEDRKNHIFTGAMLEIPSSWQMEVYREDEGLHLSGGIADREFGHWKKQLNPGERFETPRAILSSAHTESIDIFTARLTAEGKEYRTLRPETEKDLPVLFNEYCTTWGNPSQENILKILEKVKDKGFSYFVIDCGWYKKKDVPWDISMGDYTVSLELFPEGLKRAADAVKEAGMIPGIWFEIENVGPASEAYHNTEHLLKRDGMTLTTMRRRFWDMTDPWVWEYLDEKLLKLLKSCGFGYLKVDYNDEIGIGCDGKESLGEGLRENMQAVYRYFEYIRQEVPELVLENCASGGHRLEPGFMKRSSMASFSDAHECAEIPVIAANLHRAILPEQSQIWAVIRETDSIRRIVYSMTNTFLGRMCLSGDVAGLNDEQWHFIEEGISFYKAVSPVIKDGQSHIFQEGIRFLHHPEGFQTVVRVGENGQTLVVIHVFGGQIPDIIRIPLPEGVTGRIQRAYQEKEEQADIKDGFFLYIPRENFTAAAFLIF